MANIGEKLAARLGYSPFLDSVLLQFDKHIIECFEDRVEKEDALDQKEEALRQKAKALRDAAKENLLSTTNLIETKSCPQVNKSVIKASCWGY